MRTLLARLFTLAARPLSIVMPGLRGSTAVKPLSSPFYALEAPALDGLMVDFRRFDGQVALVVNVASQCGFTPQYAGLQALHARYAPRGFSVLGFPSNDFGGQEPGSADEIRTFCDREYGVTFPLFAKVQTKGGPGQSAVYARLGESGHLPSWNYFKYLVDGNGQVAAVFPSNVPPESPAIVKAIERALAQ